VQTTSVRAFRTDEASDVERVGSAKDNDERNLGCNNVSDHLLGLARKVK
jgi:hypothetical protein